MRIIRKKILILIIVLLIFSLAACKSKTEEVNNEVPKNLNPIIFKDSEFEKRIREVLKRETGAIYEKDLETIKELYISGISIEKVVCDEFDNFSLDERTKKTYSYTDINGKSYTGTGEIKELDDLKYFKSLENLTINRNEIDELGEIVNLTKLTYLNLDHNNIKSLRGIGKLVNLKELHFRHNNIEIFDAENSLENCEVLSLGYNPLTTLRGMSQMKKLKRLDIYYARKLSNIEELQHLTKLTYLKIEDTKVSDISSLEKLTNLEELILSFNDIEDITPLANLKYLELLDLECNYFIKDISPLKDLTDLHTLILSSNGISTADVLRNLKNLEILYLDCTKISDLSPLENLTYLKELDIWHSHVTEVKPIADLYLQDLFLDKGSIKDLELLTNVRDIIDTGHGCLEDD